MNEIEHEIVESFNEALSQYDPSDFERFGVALGLTSTEDLNLIRDFAGLTGMLYRQTLFLDRPPLPKKDTLRQIKKVENAARRLIDNLDDLAGNPNAVNSLKEFSRHKIAPDHRLQREISNGQKQVGDTFSKVDLRDPHPFQELIDPLVGLERTAGSTNGNWFKRVETDRTEAIEIWVACMSFFWSIETGDIVPTGHYYKEIGDYSSEALTALTSLLQRIDPKAPKRAVLDAVRTFKKHLVSDDPSFVEYAILISTIPLPTLVKRDCLATSKERLAQHLRLTSQQMHVAVELSKNPPAMKPGSSVEESKAALGEAISRIISAQ